MATAPYQRLGRILYPLCVTRDLHHLTSSSHNSLFGGFLIALSSLPEWLQWIKYLSLFRYSLEAMSINEINGMYFCPNGTFTEQPAEFENCTSGSLALDNLGYSTDQNWLWYDQVGLVGLSLIFLAITYINLLTIKKLK